MIIRNKKLIELKYIEAGNVILYDSKYYIVSKFEKDNLVKVLDLEDGMMINLSKEEFVCRVKCELSILE